MGLLACFGQDGRTQDDEEVQLKHVGCLQGFWVKKSKAPPRSPRSNYQEAGARSVGENSPTTLAWRNSLFIPGNPQYPGKSTPRDQSAAGEAQPTVALRLSVNISPNNTSGLQDVTSPTIATSNPQPSESLLKAANLDVSENNTKASQPDELTACWQQDASKPRVLNAGHIQTGNTELHGNDGYPDDETSSFVSCAESFASLYSARSQFSVMWQATEDTQHSSQDYQHSCSERSSDFGDGVRVMNTINSICSREASVCVSRRATRMSEVGIQPASNRSSGSARMQAMVARLNQAKSGAMSQQQGELVLRQHNQELQQQLQLQLAHQQKDQLHEADDHCHERGLATGSQQRASHTLAAAVPDMLETERKNLGQEDSSKVAVSVSGSELKTGSDIANAVQTGAGDAADNSENPQAERRGTHSSSEVLVSVSQTELNVNPAAPAAHAWKHAHVLRKSSKQYKQQGHPCGACHTLLAYCKEEGISATELASQPHLIDSLELDVDTATMSRLIHATVMMEEAALKVMDDSEWEIVRDDVLRVCYQHKPGTTVHSFKGRTILEAPVEHLVAMTREFDLSKTWNKYAIDTVIVKEYSPAELLCATVLWMPWPLANINLVVEAVGADLLNHMGGFFVAFHSPKDHKDPAYMKGVKGGDPNHMYLKIAPGSCLFFEPLPPAKPGGPPRCRATVEVHTDPGLKHVPAFLVSFILKVMAPFLHSAAVKLLKHEFADDTRPIPARLYERPEFYDMIRTRAEKFLSDRQ